MQAIQNVGLSDLPRQIAMAVQYRKTGWRIEGVQKQKDESKVVVPKQTATKERNIKLILDSLGTKRWASTELRLHVNETHGVEIGDSSMRDYLKELVAKELMIRSNSCQPYKYWKV